MTLTIYCVSDIVYMKFLKITYFQKGKIEKMYSDDDQFEVHTVCPKKSCPIDIATPYMAKDETSLTHSTIYISTSAFHLKN